MTVTASPKLTDRQRDVLERVDRRVPIKVIAADLGLSEARINQHIRALKDKFECADMNKLVERYRADSLGKSTDKGGRDADEAPYPYSNRYHSKWDLYAMASGSSNYCPYGSFCACDYRRNFAYCLCCDVCGLVLFSDYSAEPRYLDALPPRKTIWPLSFVERLRQRFHRQRVRQIGNQFVSLSKFDNTGLQDFLKQRLGTRTVETMLIIFLDRHERYLIGEEIGQGRGSAVELDLPMLLRRALTLGASSFLMAHNHSSGYCRPSDNDICATRRVAQAADLVGVRVIDHWIVTRCECYSILAEAIL